MKKIRIPDLYKDTLTEAKRLIQTAVEPQFIVKKKTAEPEKPVPQKAPQQKQAVGKTGFCLRCHSPLDLNPENPLCLKCYSIWIKHPDRVYSEKYCHVCGKESNQSVEKHVCYSCYKKFYK